MDKRQMKKKLKTMLPTFVYTQAWTRFLHYFDVELDIYDRSPATTRRLIEVLKDMAGGDFYDPE